MKTSRPVSLTLNPFKFSWPFTALASIVHRITGAALFIMLLDGLYLLQMALSSPQGFAEAQQWLAVPWVKVFVFLTLIGLLYHILAGIKHMLLDFHIGDTYAAAKLASQVVVVLTIVAMVPLGAWLW